MKFLVVLAATLAVAAAGTLAPGLKAKVEAGEVTEVILELPSIMDKVEKDNALQALTGNVKIDALVATLQGLTGAAQAPFVTQINALGLETQQFWAANIVLIKGVTSTTLLKMSRMVGDFVLREQFTASVNPSIEAVAANITQNNQWGVETVRAPAAWTAGHRGQGVIVAIIDTGVHPGHEALSAGHAAGGWADPHYNTANPTDQHGHGTHCAGTVLGRTNGVGVAPGAQWVACRGLNHQGSGSEASLTTCAQAMLTFPANARPHVVSNSWGGGSGQSWYNQQMQAWRNAGMVPVFAIGNSGSTCRSANSPGDQLPGEIISVGATTNTDAMASFSSRGPNTAGALKPEVSAPGQNIVSCGTGSNDYVTMSGTSMATPHTAGCVALLMGSGVTDFPTIYTRLTSSGFHPTLSNGDRNCGLPDSPNEFPNHAYGHGRIDCAAALGL